MGRRIGQQTIDLHVNTVLEGNGDILRIRGHLKAMPGVNDVVWIDVVDIVGEKASVPARLLEKLRKSYIIYCHYTTFVPSIGLVVHWQEASLSFWRITSMRR